MIQNLNEHQSKLMKEHVRDPKYKTEMCKNFTKYGKCSYKGKCRYAHGESELISKNLSNKNYKKTKCDKFHGEPGVCPYGFRCQYIHDIRGLKDLGFFENCYYQMLLRIKTYENYTGNVKAEMKSARSSIVSQSEDSGSKVEKVLGKNGKKSTANSKNKHLSQFSKFTSLYALNETYSNAVKDIPETPVAQDKSKNIEKQDLTEKYRISRLPIFEKLTSPENKKNSTPTSGIEFNPYFSQVHMSEDMLSYQNMMYHCSSNTNSPLQTAMIPQNLLFPVTNVECLSKKGYMKSGTESTATMSADESEEILSSFPKKPSPQVFATKEEVHQLNL
eukprot:CAMPEP_0170517496 /NCGR_PEP_ID=MMETSP0209-20121228/3474_1 /TAXON_ID=665100 ORGANISM="Litonotus pictus, Strain P1" /NCGR_SAMPLE_ID=MMETSP0209 /ASSEMBLY_ACC=CAM_ASM_000301 /LENGTH=331 /DNA_ID=CAMNT_0010802767 /DNA_START=18 /DNA_END=1013 /DNA_ORIENTATION=+